MELFLRGDGKVLGHTLAPLGGQLEAIQEALRAERGEVVAEGPVVGGAVPRCNRPPCDLDAEALLGGDDVDHPLERRYSFPRRGGLYTRDGRCTFLAVAPRRRRRLRWMDHRRTK